MLLSIVVPCYNEQEMVPLLAEADGALAPYCEQGLDSGVILVDDGRPTPRCPGCAGLRPTPPAQGELSGYLPVLRCRSFSRNFGKEAALSAGLMAAAGDLVAVMDADLQDPPELLARIYREAQGRHLRRGGRPGA